MATIRLDAVGFRYPVYEVAARSLKVGLMRQVSGGRIENSKGVVQVQSLDDLSLTLTDGDRLALVGRNGAGKSTLLRILAGVAYPSAGALRIKGRVVPLIERNLGINPELSGRANIELPMRLLGASSAEVRAAQKEIPEWTELGAFIDLPMRSYSEGMKARLMFAISTAVPADILVLDEWMGAGDAEFVERAEERLRQYIDRAKILVLASHATEIVTRFCNKALWLEKGQLRMLGDCAPVVEAYLADARRELS